MAILRRSNPTLEPVADPMATTAPTSPAPRRERGLPPVDPARRERTPERWRAQQEAALANEQAERERRDAERHARAETAAAEQTARGAKLRAVQAAHEAAVQGLARARLALTGAQNGGDAAAAAEALGEIDRFQRLVEATAAQLRASKW